MAEEVSHLYYVLEVKEYDNGHCWAAMNSGGGRVALSANTMREAMEKTFAKAVSLRFDGPEAPEPMVG
jgi:hypothetical protein